MKSFLLVRSQSQISTDNRLSLSASFSWLEGRQEKGMGVFWKPSLHRHAPTAHGCQTQGRCSATRQGSAVPSPERVRPRRRAQSPCPGALGCDRGSGQRCERWSHTHRTQKHYFSAESA